MIFVLLCIFPQFKDLCTMASRGVDREDWSASGAFIEERLFSRRAFKIFSTLEL